MPAPQFVKFCPVCGHATTVTGERGAIIDYCASCGADLSIYELHNTADLIGQQLADLPSPLETSVIHRSNVMVSGTGHGGVAESSPGETGAQIADSIIQRSVVTNIGSLSITKASACPLCENLVTEANPLGSCPSCEFKLCSQCSAKLNETIQQRYRGYQLEFDDGLCPQCYRQQLSAQKIAIDLRVTTSRLATSRAELFASYSDSERKGLTVADQLMATGAYLDALGEYEKVLDINAENALARQGVWTSLFQLNRFDRIIEFTAPLVSNPPSDLGNEVFYIRGAAFKGLEDFDKAKAEYIRLTSLDPKDPLPLIRIGETYLAEGALHRARQVFERAVQLDTDNRFIEPHLYLADLALRQNDYTAVEPALEHAMAIDASDTMIEQYYAQLRTAREYCQRSIDDLQTKLQTLDPDPSSLPAPEVRPKVLRTTSRLADLQVAIGTLSGARSNYERVIQVAGIADPSGAGTSIVFNLRSSRDAPAESFLSSPETLALLQKYGRLLEKLDDRTGAKAVYEQILVLKPDNPTATQGLKRLG